MKPDFFSYLITDVSYYSHDLDTFQEKLTSVFQTNKPDFALYRDKAFDDYDLFAEKFVAICKNFKVKSILHNHAPLASQLGAFGVHYSSDQLCSIGLGDNGLFRVLSCHTKEELLFAKEQGMDAATYSPIFDTPNKGEPVGLESLKEISGTIDLPIIALGGITSKAEVEAVKRHGAGGFASIRYFVS